VAFVRSEHNHRPPHHFWPRAVQKLDEPIVRRIAATSNARENLDGPVADDWIFVLKGPRQCGANRFEQLGVEVRLQLVERRDRLAPNAQVLALELLQRLNRRGQLLMSLPCRMVTCRICTFLSTKAVTLLTPSRHTERQYTNHEQRRENLAVSVCHCNPQPTETREIARRIKPGTIGRQANPGRSPAG